MAESDTARRRVIIEAVTPEIEEGRFPAKRVVGEKVTVEADIFADGHDSLQAVLLYRREGEPKWREAPMEPLVNDRWRGIFGVGGMGRYEYTIQAWVDRFGSWQRDRAKKVDAGQDVSVDLPVGSSLVARACGCCSGGNRMCETTPPIRRLVACEHSIVHGRICQSRREDAHFC